MRGTVACVALALCACGTRAEPTPRATAPAVATTPGAATPPARAAPPPVEHADYEIHEWGLVAFDVEGDGVACGSPMIGSQRGSGDSYEPVLYVQLAHGAPPVTFDAEVRAPGHAFAESWPAGATSGDTLRWSHVEAREAPPGGCGARYPGMFDPPCRTPDNYCEAASAADYEASDGACLAVGGATYDHLLYRSTVGRDALPFEVAHDGAGFVVRAKAGAPPLELTRVRRSEYGGAQLDALAFRAPAAGAEVPVPAPTTAERAPVLERLLAPLATAGLTEPERRAFANAWREAIAPESGSTRFDVDVLPAARPPVDALYYWLPAEAADRMLPLRFTPAPTAVRRALLVRISLDPPPPARRSEADVGAVEAHGVPNVAVARLARDHQADIERCHQQNGGGLCVANIDATVAADGTLHDVRVSSQPDWRPLDACIRSVVSGWQLPPPSPAGAGNVSFAVSLASR